MQVIGLEHLEEFWQRYPRAKPPLTRWLGIVTTGDVWTCFLDVRAVFPSADIVTVASGKNVVVFDIGGNKYRLITGMEYKKQLVVVLTVLTHEKYDEEKWKYTL